MSASPVDVFESRAHLLQQVNDHVRNGYRWWCTGTVPLVKAKTWAEKAEKMYTVSANINKRTREKKAGRGNAYMLMYRLDRSLSNNRLGWVLLVSDGLHPAHQEEPLHRAEQDPVELFGYQLVRESKEGQARPGWTWRMKRAEYEMWRERVIDTVRRGSDYDIRMVLKQLRGAPGFRKIREQVKQLHKLVAAEWHRRHRKGTTPQFKLPGIWKVRRMVVERVDLDTYLHALSVARRKAAAEMEGSIVLAPIVEPESVYPSEPPAVTLDAPESTPSDASASSSPARAPKRKEPRRSLRADRAQPVRQRALPLPSPMEPDAVPPWEDSASSPASDSAPAADDAEDAAAGAGDAA